MEKKVTSPIIAGLVIALFLIVLAIIAYIGDFEVQAWYRWGSTLLFCAAIIYICINYSNQKDNLVTYGNVFAFGFKTSAVVACIMVIYISLFFIFFPGAKEKALEVAREQMTKNPNMTEDQIDKGMEFARKSFYVFAIGGIAFAYVFFGLIASLLGAAFAKKRGPATPFENV